MSIFYHLKEKRISYCEHFGHAVCMAFRLIWNAGKLVVHGLYPDVFLTDATDDLEKMLKEHDKWSMSRIPIA